MESPQSPHNGSEKMKKSCKETTRDQAAPRYPLPGFVRFRNELCEKIKAERPSAKFSEIKKRVLTEWNSLTADEKKVYQDADEQAREKDMEEMAAHKQTDAYKMIKKSKKLETSRSDEGAGGSTKNVQDIPIFTDEFLEYNKVQEVQLRQLRKKNTSLEQHIAVMEGHVENMRSAVEKLQTEREKKNNLRKQQDTLEAFRSYFAEKLESVALPGTGEKPTLETIDEYVLKLIPLLQDSKNDVFFDEVKNCLSDVDFIGDS